MSNDQDYVERTLDAPPKVSMESLEAARGPNTAGWWIAATVAVAAVIGAIVLLNGARPSPAKLQAAHERSRAEAQIDDAAYGAQLAAAYAAEFAQSAQASDARATESAAKAGAANADTAAQDATATEPAAAQP
ncbi:MAG: hypothetical protein ACHP9T_16405 [Caulobacterales bacterium]|jgi:hypothetical protein